MIMEQYREKLLHIIIDLIENKDVIQFYSGFRGDFDLYCSSLIYELKDSRAREIKYQNTISSLAKDLEYMKEIDEGMEDMNNVIREYIESVEKETTSGAEERL